MVVVSVLSACGTVAGSERIALSRAPASPMTTAAPAEVAEVAEAVNPLPLAGLPAVVTIPPVVADLLTPEGPTPATEPPPAPALARSDSSGAAAYAGLGTWIDAYDWSLTFGKDGPLVETADIDRMADLGVQTLYVQTSRWNAPEDILEPERLIPLIDRAQARGMDVVAWYLPTFVDPATDLRRLLAAARLDVDAVAVDIESKDVGDVTERNQRLVALSAELRQALPGVALGAIVFPPVVMEVINPGFWPGFPWEDLAPYYDVWVPMAYQSFRTQASGYRDGGLYTAENIDRLRAHLGDVPVHSVGGIADATTADDVDGMVGAASERGAVGGSLYDWRTTDADLWPHLRAFRR